MPYVDALGARFMACAAGGNGSCPNLPAVLLEGLKSADNSRQGRAWRAGNGPESGQDEREEIRDGDEAGFCASG